MHHSFEKGSLAAVLMLLLLTAFCLIHVKPGSAPHTLCLLSLLVNLPFLLFLLMRLRKAVKRADSQPNNPQKHEGGNQ